MKFKIGDTVRLIGLEEMIKRRGLSHNHAAYFKNHFLEPGDLGIVIKCYNNCVVDIKWEKNIMTDDGLSWNEDYFDLVKPFKYKTYLQYIKGLLR